jgi:hypothetical protein
MYVASISISVIKHNLKVLILLLNTISPTDNACAQGVGCEEGEEEITCYAGADSS